MYKGIFEKVHTSGKGMKKKKRDSFESESVCMTKRYTLNLEFSLGRNGNEKKNIYIYTYI